ncbi:MAG TPA: hypothetical protein VGO34_05425 [Alphaproteobacteria bacterium]
MTRAMIVLIPMLLLSACSSGGRWAGFNNCSADGSVVMVEYPNAQGNYDTLNNGPCKSASGN